MFRRPQAKACAYKGGMGGKRRLAPWPQAVGAGCNRGLVAAGFSPRVGWRVVPRGLVGIC